MRATRAWHPRYGSSCIGGIERGERDPSLVNILRIAEALGVSASQLLAPTEEGADRLVR